MKVYVVQADNCEAYEDFWHWTEGVFSSFYFQHGGDVTQNGY